MRSSVADTCGRQGGRFPCDGFGSSLPVPPRAAPGRRCAPVAGQPSSLPPTVARAPTPPALARTIFPSSCTRPPSLEEQPDETHAFGPAAALVAEWRQLRTGGDATGSRVDRARAWVRRWELETELLQEFHLTLPPETEPLDEASRTDHLRWRQNALVEARVELAGARRVRLLRRILTLGLWWK